MKRGPRAKLAGRGLRPDGLLGWWAGLAAAGAIVAAGAVAHASAQPPADADTLTAPAAPPAPLSAPPFSAEPVAAEARRVSPTRAVLVTPLFPGWGQLYSDNGWRAVLAFGAESFYWSHLLMNDRKAVRHQDHARTLAPSEVRTLYDLQVEEYRERVRDFAWWSLGALLIIALDAYVDAHLDAFEDDPAPVPALDQTPAAHAWRAEPPPGPDGLVVWRWRCTF